MTLDAKPSRFRYSIENLMVLMAVLGCGVGLAVRYWPEDEGPVAERRSIELELQRMRQSHRPIDDHDDLNRLQFRVDNSNSLTAEERTRWRVEIDSLLIRSRRAAIERREE